MLYRRNPIKNIRYPRPASHLEDTLEQNKTVENIPAELQNLPLPNIASDSPCQRCGPVINKNLSPLHILKDSIGIEEILLLGTILLLIEEKIEDEILLIILVYLLVAGLEQRK
ncbi:MAG: hypothetical protein Q8942_18225 [Bacillota bacterium]|nr:hypothetical protein [Bacillota bacterium]